MQWGLRLPGFDANNLTDGKNQIVDIVIEGKEHQFEKFREFVQTNKPSGARISNISTQDYDGDVMRIGEYSQAITAMQMLKAIPTLLEVHDNTRSTPEIPEEIRGLREDIQPGFATGMPLTEGRPASIGLSYNDLDHQIIQECL